MVLTTIQKLGFDPVKEYEQLRFFETHNDLKEWQKYISSSQIIYGKTRVTVIESNITVIEGEE